MNDECKKKCQIFTPKKNVIQLLDWVGYNNNIYGKKILENSCGDGQILIEIITRYIEDGLKQNYSLNEIKKGLENDIYGVEIDNLHLVKCKSNLNKITSKYKINKVKWNILGQDILQKPLNIKFDYIVGNPPYIKYKLLDETTRKFLKNNYDVCKEGKFDYCYAFIESGIKHLNSNGKMAYLIPSNIFKNVFANNLRIYLKPYLKEIYDFKEKKLFTKNKNGNLTKDILTSSAIIIIDKEYIINQIKYYDLNLKEEYVINKDELKEKWIFNTDFQPIGECTKKFGDYFFASNSIATLCNDIYIIKKFDNISKDYIKYNKMNIERKILKKAVSPRNLMMKNKEFIIFPYYYNNGLKKYSEIDIKNLYPEAYRYLNHNKKRLLNRTSDKNINWFEYGRSQALSNLNQKKLLLSTIITKKVAVYEISKNEIPYSGIYIISKTNDLKYAKKILESDRFLKYIKSIGINASGSSVRITSKDINNYILDEGDKVNE